MGFWKNVFKKESVGEQKAMLTDSDKKTLQDELKILEKQLKDSVKEDRAAILCRLGSCCFELDKTDEAIKYYELCIGENPAEEKPRMDLLRLYNIKRKAAAIDKDDKMLQICLDKIDALMKLNKDIIRRV